MPIDWVPQGIFLALIGLGVGLWLLARGMAGYREATRMADTATSRIASLAAGEVQVSGAIEPAELTLVSPLQSSLCVYYRSTVDGADDGPDLTPALAQLGSDFHEERAVGFRVRDATGDIRVFPAGRALGRPDRARRHDRADGRRTAWAPGPDRLGARTDRPRPRRRDRGPTRLAARSALLQTARHPRWQCPPGARKWRPPAALP